MNLMEECFRLWPENRVARSIVSLLSIVFGLLIIYLWLGPEQMWAEFWIIVAMVLVPVLVVCGRIVWLYSGPPRQPEPMDDTTRRTLVRLGSAAFGMMTAGIGFSIGKSVTSEANLSPAQGLEGKYIIKQQFRIAELVNPKRPVITDKVFDECDIFGPAVLFLSGVGMVTNCQITVIGTSADDTFWETSRPITGCIQIVNCEFKRCTFHFIGFAGERALIDKFKRSSMR